MYNKNTDIEKSYKLKNCRQVAEAVAFRLSINIEGIEFRAIFLSSSSVKNNLDAIAEWLYKKDQNLSEVNDELIRKYKSELEVFLSELIS
jgi:hypothetical protein